MSYDYVACWAHSISYCLKSWSYYIINFILFIKSIEIILCIFIYNPFAYFLIITFTDNYYLLKIFLFSSAFPTSYRHQSGLPSIYILKTSFLKKNPKVCLRIYVLYPFSDEKKMLLGIIFNYYQWRNIIEHWN